MNSPVHVISDQAPAVAMMIPFTGRSKSMEEALHSLLNQDYPQLTAYLATQTANDAAWQLAEELVAFYPHARHVEAGSATACSQKNYNLLACLGQIDRQSGPKPDIYVFCDANHTSRPDFVSELVRPVQAGRAIFSTGYRRTQLQAVHDVISTAFHIIAGTMLTLQKIPCFTQPWGGALAAKASAFNELEICALWSRTVADDSSLAGLLIKKGIRTAFCPLAILDSPVGRISKEYLDSWLFRQILNAKFYTFSTWLLIGMALFALLGGFAAALALAAFSFPCYPAMAVLGLYIFLCPLAVKKLRVAPAEHSSGAVWFKAISVAVKTAVTAYLKTVPSRTLRWRDYRYHLSADGKVRKVERT